MARASRTCRDACRDRLPAVTGRTFPAFPAHAHPELCVSGKRPIGGVETHGSIWYNTWNRCIMLYCTPHLLQNILLISWVALILFFVCFFYYDSETMVNSSRPSDAYMRLVGAWSAPSHYLNQWWNISNSILRNKHQCNLKRNLIIFIHGYAFEIVVWKMAAISSRPQCVKFIDRGRPRSLYPT